MSDDAIKSILKKLVAERYFTVKDTGKKLDLIEEAVQQIRQYIEDVKDKSLLDVLSRINDKALKTAHAKGTGYEELAVTYDKAIMKELADLSELREPME